MSILDPQTLLAGMGPWVLGGLSLMIFVESGLLFPFLPGDSLLVTAGLLHQSLGLSVALCAFVAAAAGDQVGFFLGHRFGRRWFRPDARVLKTAHLEQAEAFFERHGGKALVLGRFVPVVRTFVPLAAGTSGYPYRRFIVWNLTGAFLWAVGMTVLGSLLGGLPFVADHIDLLAVGLVVVSVLPIVVTALRRSHTGRAEKTATATNPRARTDEEAVGDRS
ncbi:DedA family protein [Frigoribacterium sp. Leaf172]|uniref:DedA family protein n=1 Tax=Frigoribacterium sp. Leaf172 TaxID=1736285 RepID=UPI0006F450F2|nr:VTT domain-containing protein [Frigoribacterium sp. Leaf172]KQR66003.1 alkaline phosphatase [Frigoribacterium sp. Leaf172]